MSNCMCRVFCTAVALTAISMPGCTAATAPPAVAIVEPLDPALCQETPFDIPDITEVPPPKAGALAYANGVLVFVPNDQGLPINANWTEDGRLLLQVEGQPDRTIGVNVHWSYREDEKVLVNPLAQMSSEEVRDCGEFVCKRGPPRSPRNCSSSIPHGYVSRLQKEWPCLLTEPFHHCRLARGI